MKRIVLTCAALLLSGQFKPPCNITVTRREGAEGKLEEHLFFDAVPAPVEKVPEAPKAGAGGGGGAGKSSGSSKAS